MHLSDIKVGQKAVVLGFEDSSPSLRQRLLALGFVPGATLSVKRMAPLGDPMELEIAGSLISLRRKEVSFVLVEITP